MECYGQNIAYGVRAGPQHSEQPVAPFRPVSECRMPERLGFGLVFNSAGRRPLSMVGIRVWKWRSGSDGARFLIRSESCPNQAVRSGCLMLTSAEEGDGSHATEEETREAEVVNLGPPVTIKRSALLTSPDFWVQVGIFVFSAGFVDAGFSGDWSRIGVLSKQTEEELQIAALGLVPLAVTVIWSISHRQKQL